MSNPNVPHKNTGDTLSATEINSIVTSIGTKQDLASVVFKEAALLGDSITLRQTFPTGAEAIQGTEGGWNWGNYFAGAPFQFTQNMGVNGDLAGNIFSRIDSIMSNIDCVFIMGATNDIVLTSSSATAPQITTIYNSLVAIFTDGLTKLKAMGKHICIATIPPNNAYTTGDSRISLLDQMNAWIATTVSLGLADFVVDLFTATWDSTQPTKRFFKTHYNSSAGGTDGQTHLSNLGGQAWGRAALIAIKGMYNISSCQQSTRMIGMQDQLAWIGRFTTGLNPTFTGPTYGAGFGSTGLASGWQIASVGSGAPTGVCTLYPFTLGSDFVGPNAQVVGTQESWQKIVISSAVSGSSVKLNLFAEMGPNVFPAGASFGDIFWVTADVLIESPVNVNQVILWGNARWGTDATNTAYGISDRLAYTKAGISSIAGLTDYTIEQGYRAVLITEPIRVPENVFGGIGLATDVYMYVNFNGAGGCTVSWGRVKFWRKMF